MSDLHQSYRQGGAEAAPAMDAGLRDYMLGVYAKAALGLALCGATAWLTANVPEVRDLLFRTVTTPGASRLTGLTLLGSLVVFAPVFLLLSAGFFLKAPSAAKTATLYWSVVTLVGASCGTLFLTFTGASIAATFAISAASFGALSLFGYVAQRDLTPLGGFLFMGLIGVIGALGLNLLLHSPLLLYVANMAGVLIFAGLIAYDTQRLKLAYHKLGGDHAERRIATNLGALSLFINFINLFQLLLVMASGERR